MIEMMRRNWPEYLMEGAELGLFMISASLFGVLLFHPGSPVARALPDPIERRVLMGLAMGLTAIGIIYSPWGKQSGAHFNPSATITFWRLGRMRGEDALLYVVSQIAGGVAGMIAALAIARSALSHPDVNYVVTVPGPWGDLPAFAAEIAIAFIQMSLVLNVSQTPRLARFTGLVAGAMVAAYIAVESPISGMSLNPARSFASAVVANEWPAFWIYLTAPLIGMLGAAQIFVASRGASRVLCAKLHHDNDRRCIFLCRWMSGVPSAVEPSDGGAVSAAGRSA